MNDLLSKEEFEKLDDLRRIYGKKELASFFNVGSVAPEDITVQSSLKIKSGIRRFWKSHMKTIQK